MQNIRSIYGYFVGKIVAGEKINGKKFSAKLIAIEGEKLVFETSKGVRLINDSSDIKFLMEYRPELAKPKPVVI